jgi:glutaminyl-peptide cyclotransferase
MRRSIAVVVVLLLLALAGTAAAQTATPPPPDSTPEITPESTALAPVEILQPDVLNTYPHDTSAFTEGLLYYDGFLYESTGQYGQSDVRKVELKTGKVQQKLPLDPAIFGEGLALVDDHLYQLSWKEQKAFVYDRDTFKNVGEFDYEGQGWGLCYDGTQLWMSNGTDTVVARDPATFGITRRVQLTFQGYTLDKVATSNGTLFSQIFSQVNELECVGDSIYANVWETNFILRIDAATGAMTGIIDASSLLTTDERSQLASGAVLNGIAYDPDSDTFFLTGKYWPKLFEVTFKVISTISLSGG